MMRIYEIPSLSRREQQRGLMLVMVLWVVTILSLLMYSLLYSLTLETVLTSTRKKSMQAEALARAGFAKAVADLKNDLIVDNTDDEDPPFDAEGDFWADPEEGKEEVEFGDGVYNVTVKDHERLLNLNNHSGTNKVLFQKIAEEIGYDEEDAKIVAAAIVDYGDRDEICVLDEYLGQPEGLVYGTLLAEDRGLSTREDDVEYIKMSNEGYYNVGELLEVYGVTPDLYFGPETPEAEHYKKVMGYEDGRRSFDRFQMERRRRSRLDDGPPKGLRDYFNVRINSQLNLNTAEHHVLTALFKAAGNENGEDVAEDVIRTRRGGSDRRVDNDNAFKSPQDLQQHADIASWVGQAGNFHPIGFTSAQFDIISVATVNGVSKTLTASVTRQMITYQREESFELLDRAREFEDQNRGLQERIEDSDNELIRRIPVVYLDRWKKM